MNTLGIEIYVLCTDKDGRNTATAHQVWNAERFMAARRADAVKVGGKANAIQITRQEYDLARTPRESNAR